MLKRKRVYERPSKDDGARVLVDRLWPRGLSTARAAVTWWPRQLAPSDALRKWYRHDPDRWQEFRRRYLRELRDGKKRKDLLELRRLARAGPVTVVYAAKDEDRNNAAVLAEFLKRRTRQKG